MRDERPVGVTDEVCAALVHCGACRRGAFGRFGCPAGKVTGAEVGLGDRVKGIADCGLRLAAWGRRRWRRQGRRRRHRCGCAARQRRLNAWWARVRVRVGPEKKLQRSLPFGLKAMRDRVISSYRRWFVDPR